MFFAWPAFTGKGTRIKWRSTEVNSRQNFAGTGKCNRGVSRQHRKVQQQKKKHTKGPAGTACRETELTPAPFSSQVRRPGEGPTDPKVERVVWEGLLRHLLPSKWRRRAAVWSLSQKSEGPRPLCRSKA